MKRFIDLQGNWDIFKITFGNLHNLSTYLYTLLKCFRASIDFYYVCWNMTGVKNMMDLMSID